MRRTSVYVAVWVVVMALLWFIGAAWWGLLWAGALAAVLLWRHHRRARRAAELRRAGELGRATRGREGQ
jgi:hypothetical protein